MSKSIEDKIKEIKMKSEMFDKSRPEKDEFITKMRETLNLKSETKGVLKSELMAKKKQPATLKEIPKVIEFSVASTPATGNMRVDRRVMTDPLFSQTEEEAIDEYQQRKMETESMQGRGGGDHYNSKLITNQQQTCMDTTTNVHVLGEEEGEDEEGDIERLLQDKEFMKIISSRLAGLDSELQSQRVQVEAIFDENQESSEDRMLGNNIEKSHVQSLDREAEKALQEQRVDLRMVSGISFAEESIAVSQGDISDEDLNKNNQEAGLVQVQDVNICNKPKAHLLSPSVVTSSLMDPTDSNIVLGGLANGQICRWDLRAKKLPVSTSKQTESVKHSLQVNSLTLTKYKDENCLAASSFDGKVIMWDLKEFKMMYCPEHLGDQVSLASFAMPRQSPDFFAAANVYGTIGVFSWQASSTNIGSSLKDHISVVTGMDQQYPIEEDADQSSCLLSSGLDNTVKLWNHKWSDKPLVSFAYADEFIGDVKWNPSDRCVFACGDANGQMQFQNLDQSTEVPQQQDRITNNNLAISKICWMNFKDHYNQIAAGDMQGKVYLNKIKIEQYNNNHNDKFINSVKQLKDEILFQ